MKRKSCLTIVLALGSIALSACGQQTAPKPTNITIKAVGDKNSVKVGETLQFSAVVAPEGVEQKVNWTIAPLTGAATISESGLFTATKEGNVNVVATSWSDEAVKATYPVTITKAEIVLTKLDIVASKTELDINETVQLAVRTTPEGASNDVLWEVNNTEIATINVAGQLKALKAGTVKVTATSKKDSLIKATKEFTVKAGQAGPDTPENPDVDWNTVKVSTVDEYLAAKKDEKLKVKGTCTAICANGEKGVTYYLSNGKAGILVYQQKAALGVPEIGKVYEVGGTKKVANGTHEISNAEVFKAIDEKVDYVTTDISSLKFGDLNTMASYQGGIVNFKDAVITSIPPDLKKDFSVGFAIGKNESTIRIDNDFMSADEFTAFGKMFESAVIGQKFSAKGYMNAFGYGKPKNQITVLNTKDIAITELSDQEKADLYVKEISIKSSYTKDITKVDLPTTLASLEGSTISWESDNAAVSADGTITHGDTMLTVKLTATLTYKEAKATKSFVVTVFPKNDDNLSEVHTLDFEDCTLKEGGQGNVSAERPGYTDKGDNTVNLGTPKTKWFMTNCLIAGDTGDHKEGKFAARLKCDEADQTKSGIIRLEKDYDFSMIEFKLATFNAHAHGAEVYVSYSNDSGATWKNIEDRDAIATSYELETFRVEIPNANATTRVALNYRARSSTSTINIDSIRLLKVKA